MMDTGPDGTAPATSVRQGIEAGLAAGFLMVVFALVVRLVSGAPTITELAADWFTLVLPPPTIDYLLRVLSFSAKPLMFAGLLTAQVLAGGAAGAAYIRLSSRWSMARRGEWPRVGGYALALWLVSMVTLVPIFGGGFFGAAAVGGQTGFLVTTFLAYAVYGVTLAYRLIERAGQPFRAPVALGRRSFLRQMAGWTIFAVVFVYGAKWLMNLGARGMSASGTFRTPGVLSTEITPNDEFYVVSKNISDPKLEASGWSLDVAGLVVVPFAVGYEDLKAMPSVERAVTLECISNEVGGDLISTAIWKGVPLKSILEEAKLSPGVVDIVFRAADGYSESISLEKAMNSEAMVAYEMNGEPLPSEHGYPARLINPGFFGLKSVKWLTGIEPVDHDYAGYWQRRGWTDRPVVQTMSRIDTPATDTSHPPSEIQVAGVAFAGDRGISRVEVSFDAGATWAEVEETSEPLSPYTWVIWKSRLALASGGKVQVQIRATDGEGAVQTSARRGTLPEGATGHHSVRLEFKSG